VARQEPLHQLVGAPADRSRGNVEHHAGADASAERTDSFVAVNVADRLENISVMYFFLFKIAAAWSGLKLKRLLSNVLPEFFRLF
jgi:hypothetical protein